ncbi:hypothetical protein PHMEG_00032625 [Phytophthora megakarya]|uniref:CCHC-type domain-containing protein n=1 Tax=Phytophthora megakarya TaxID=4795 RepID=A0A225UUE9_9STRA|nr:hypothetical protein PHMEG_00032625 [Phytophthora megakarya]
MPTSRWNFQAATQDLYESLKILVGERVPTPDLNYQTGSSHYASATSEPNSDSPRAPPRMSLGPSGAKYLRSRGNRQDQRPTTLGRTPEKPDHQKEREIPAERTTPTTDSTGSSNKLSEYFQMAMNRFLKEQNLMTAQPPPLGTQDVDMESVGTPDLNSWEYDPDDLGIPSSSAISDLKEFAEKDMDEDRARAWIGKVKSAFQRDQATEEEKCLTFGDLMVGSAKNWHQQLSRTTKPKWVDLLESFQTQYCGLGMSVAWQYYHARKRSEETPLDYLYRLNVAALRAKLKVKDGNPKARREHVDHYIETLGDPELADRLTLLRLADVDDLEEVLRSRERAKSRQRRSAFGSKFRQKVPTSAPTAPARPAVRAIQTHDPSSESDGVSGSDGSDSEGDQQRIFLAAAEEKLICARGALRDPDPARSQTKASEGARISDHRGPGDRDHQDRDRCSHCGSRKHTDLDCWKRLTCEKCGKRGHPTDRCLYACRGCGDVHEAGECPMEEFYNQIRKWYDPTRHAGLFPEQVEKMLN